jgi:cephalosporin hydroxylase
MLRSNSDMPEVNKPNENGLRRTLDVRLVDGLLELSELKGELRASLQAINEKIDRLLVLQDKVERHSVAIGRLKTMTSLLSAGVALVVSVAKDWVLGKK